MPNILSDIYTAIRMTGDVRQARKNGAADIKIYPIWKTQTVNLGYWPWTMEACLYRGEELKAMRTAFESFPEETQHRLTFSPEKGEWCDRVQLWQNALRPTMDPKMYHAVILKLIQFGIHCRKMRGIK